MEFWGFGAYGFRFWGLENSKGCVPKLSSPISKSPKQETIKP